MIRTLSTSLVLAGALAATGLSMLTGPDLPPAGSAAPEIEAATWFNHIGRNPDLDSLRGKAVLLEFWATWWGPCKGSWPHLQELQDEFRDSGLVVLAVSDEDDGKVSEYLETMGISNVRVAAGFSSGDSWGVRSYPSAALIDPEGNVAWTGHPSEVTGGKVKKLLKGVKASKAGYLAYELGREVPAPLKAAAKAGAEGKLGKAIEAAEAVAKDETVPAEVREQATALAAEFVAYGELLSAQAEALITKRAMVLGVSVYEDLSKALDGTELGEAVSKRLAEIGKDDDLQKELAADEAWAKAMEAVERRGAKKAKPKFEAIVKKYAGTKAAERAIKKLRKL